VQSTTPDLATDKRGYIAVADPQTLRTSKQGVFAGGDIVTGAATVILAMGAGRNAARSIDAYLRTGAW
jgi:glutamate synthase (NADPH/NADH) small chain